MDNKNDSLNSVQQTNSITCVCYPIQQCPYGLSTCSSKTGCFHSLDLDDTNTFVIYEVKGCFSNDTDQVDLHCRSFIPKHQDVRCCRLTDGDFCNQNLFSVYHRTLYDLKALSCRQLLLSIFPPLSLLIVGLLLIALFWKYFLSRQPSEHKCYEIFSAYKSCSFISSGCPKIRFKSYENGSDSVYLRPFRTADESSNYPNQFQFRTMKWANQPINRVPNHPLQKTRSTSDLVGCTTGSGSGSGVPFLVNSTIARQVHLLSCIGKGRFGEVWRANYQDEIVAAKIFSSRDEASWARETEVYNTGLLRHQNLLAYYASDMISRGGCTQLWLITAYHPRGCLHNYLLENSFSLTEGLRLARSAAAGLAFLHSEFTGLQAKPAIAHRDIKSKNILVREDGETCIADLGLALMCTSPFRSNGGLGVSTGNGQLFIGANASSGGLMGGLVFGGPAAANSIPSTLGPPPAGPRVGTKRYMAPELLAPRTIVTPEKNLPSKEIYSAVSNSKDHITDKDYNEEYPITKDMEIYPSGDKFNSAAVGTDAQEVNFSTKVHSHLPFEVYQAADIYAMALVFWEIARRTKGTSLNSSETEEYQIPFWDAVPPDPTFAQMRRIVAPDANFNALAYKDSSTGTDTTEQDIRSALEPPAHDPSRPPISSRWLSDPVLERFTQLIQECWHKDWRSRLSALRIRKTLVCLELQASKLGAKMSEFSEDATAFETRTYGSFALLDHTSSD